MRFKAFVLRGGKVPGTTFDARETVVHIITHKSFWRYKPIDDR